jgi:hypothetical protein
MQVAGVGVQQRPEDIRPEPYRLWGGHVGPVQQLSGS